MAETSLTQSKINFDTCSITELNGKLDIMPIGAVYTQYPGQLPPAELFGGTWSNITSMYAGLFFRAEGGNANAFEGGSQEDKIRPIRGTQTRSKVDTGEWGSETSYGNGCFTTSVTGQNTRSGGSWWWLSHLTLTFDANANSRNYGNPMAGHADGPEIRPVNTSIRIWKRTA